MTIPVPAPTSPVSAARLSRPLSWRPDLGAWSPSHPRSPILARCSLALAFWDLRAPAPPRTALRRSGCQRRGWWTPGWRPAGTGPRPPTRLSSGSARRSGASRVCPVHLLPLPRTAVSPRAISASGPVTASKTAPLCRFASIATWRAILPASARGPAVPPQSRSCAAPPRLKSRRWRPDPRRHLVLGVFHWILGRTQCRRR